MDHTSCEHLFPDWPHVEYQIKIIKQKKKDTAHWATVLQQPLLRPAPIAPHHLVGGTGLTVLHPHTKIKQVRTETVPAAWNTQSLIIMMTGQMVKDFSFYFQVEKSKIKM
jgi:hypothetical protein